MPLVLTITILFLDFSIQRAQVVPDSTLWALLGKAPIVMQFLALVDWKSNNSRLPGPRHIFGDDFWSTKFRVWRCASNDSCPRQSLPSFELLKSWTSWV